MANLNQGKQAHITIFTSTLLPPREFTNPAISGSPKQKWNGFGELSSQAPEIGPSSASQGLGSITGASKQGCVHSSAPIASLKDL